MAVWNSINYSEIQGFNRTDAEFYKPDYQKSFGRVKSHDGERISHFAYITDGIHASPQIVQNGIRYISAKCVKDNEFVVDNCIQISREQNGQNPRTQLTNNDVIITTVGTIGNVAVVEPYLTPSNCDRHVGIIRITDIGNVSPYYLSTFLNSKYGKFQSLREAAGNVQLNLYIRNIGHIVVPRLGKYEEDIADCTRRAYLFRNESKTIYIQAQNLLESEIGLDKLNFPKPVGYTAQFSDLEQSRRLDPEYFDPIASSIVKRISSFDHVRLGSNCNIGNGFPWNSKRFFEDNSGEPVVRIRNIRPSHIDVEELSSIDPKYARNIGFPKAKERDVVVGMDGFKYFYASLLVGDCYVNQRVAHLNWNRGAKVSPEYATFIINSRVGQSQLLRDMTIATTVGHITNRNIFNLLIPFVSDSFHRQITNLVKQSIDKKVESKRLLDQAKTRVEQLIEEAVRS